jgi:cytochrome P450
MSQFRHADELAGLRGLFRFTGDPLGRLEHTHQLYGSRVYYQQWRTPFAVLTDPIAIEELLLGNAHALQKDQFTAQLARVLGQGLVTSEGELWRRQRKLLAPSFQPKQIESFAEVMVERTLAVLADYEDGQLRDVHADMMRLTLDIVVRTLFGSSVVRASEVDEHLDVVLRAFNTLLFSWRAVFPPWTPFAARRQLSRSRDKLQSVVREIIQQKREHASRSNDLLSRLILATDESGQGMSDAQLLDESMTVFLAGHETTALALSYALCCLAQHPEQRARLEQELNDVLGENQASLAHVNQLVFCRAVLQEALRLYPPVWAIARSAVRSLELDGKRFEPKTQFLLPQWVVHRDPQWFSEPLAFRPQRWLNGECDKLPRFAYFPFGGGSRVCIGNHFALLEATLALSTIAQSVRLELAPEFRLQFAPTITLRPSGPVEMRVTRRVASV